MAAKTTTASRDVTAELAYLTRALKAPTLREAVGRLAERARSETWSYEEFLAACLQREVSARESHGGEGRIRAARFPSRKSLEEFDFDHARGLKRDLIAHLGTLDFVTAKDNVVVLGPPGTGYHCAFLLSAVSNSPDWSGLTWMRRPFRRPRLMWTACSSPRCTLCNTVCRARTRALAASSSAIQPSGASGWMRSRRAWSMRMRQGAPGVSCSAVMKPSRIQR